MANDIIEIGLVVKDKGLKESLNTVSRLEAQIIKASKAVDQGRITQDRYNKVLLQAKRDYELLGVSSQKATAEIRKFAAAQTGVVNTFQASEKAAKRFQLGVQQAGYQVGDFAVQVTSGTNPLVAFSQQATQLVSFFGGPWGAAVGAAIAIVSAFGVAFMKANEGAEKSLMTLKDATKGVKEEIQNLRQEQQKLKYSAELEEEVRLNVEIERLTKSITGLEKTASKAKSSSSKSLQLAADAAKETRAELQEQLSLLENERIELEKQAYLTEKKIDAEKKLREFLWDIEEASKNVSFNISNISFANALAGAKSFASVLKSLLPEEYQASVDRTTETKQAAAIKQKELEMRLAGENAVAIAGEIAAMKERDRQINAGLPANETLIENYRKAAEVEAAADEALANYSKSLKTGGKAAKDAAREFEKLVAEIEKIEEAHDPLLKFNNDLEHLNELFKTGLLSQKAYNKELERLQKELIDSIPYVNELSDAFTQFIMSGLKNFSDFVSSIKSMFVKMLSDMITTALRNKIIIPIAASMGSSAAASTLSTAGTLASGTLGASIAGGATAFGAGLTTSLGFGTTTTGAAAMAASPTLAAIGSIAGPLLAVAAVFSFFSKKTKELDNGLQVTVKNMDAFVETFQTIKTTRFWGLSSKTTTSATEASAEISDPIVEAVQGIQQSVMDAAAMFGYGSETFDNFIYEMEVSLKGLTEDQKIEKINEELLKMGDAFAALTGHFETMNELLEAANQRMELQNRLDQLLGNNAAILARQREAELAAMHELNRPLAQAIYQLEDAQAAVSNAFASLRASIDKVVADLKVKLDVANEAVNRSRSIVNQLESALSGRYVSGSITSTFARREGALNFIRGGDFSDENRLEEALNVIGEPTEQLFGSFEDYARDFYATNGVISEAKKVAETQLSADEQQVALLEQQIADTENQYQLMVDQYNALMGIDTSVKSVEEAVANLKDALGALSVAQEYAKGQEGRDKIAALEAAAAATVIPEAIGEIIKEVGVKKGQSSVYTSTGEVFSSAVGKSNATELANARLEYEAAQAARNDEITAAYEKLDSLRQQITDAGGVPTFAAGGTHYGGIRMVGERGPELEATGPSRIFSHNQTKGMFRDPDLKDAVRSLKEEVSGLRSEQRQIQMDISKYTKRSYDLERKWDVDGLPATRT